MKNRPLRTRSRPSDQETATGQMTCLYSVSPGLGSCQGKSSPSMQKFELFG